MTRRPFATTIAAVLVAFCLSSSAALAAHDGVPDPIPLTTNWEKIADPAAVGVRRGLWRPGNDAAWKPTVVPSVFSTQTQQERYAGTVGWYRVSFMAPPATPGFRWAAHFEQVRRITQVWLNGVKIGRHDDGFVPFDMALRDALKPGQRNVLVVRADNRKRKDPREGWWNWGGITRPVTLVPQGALVLRNAGVLSDVDCPADGGACRTAAIFDGILENRGTSPIPGGEVAVRIGGVTTTVTGRPLAPGEQTRVRRTIPLPGARLWSPERPHLHDVTLTTSASGVVQQVDRWRTGLREVKVRGGMLTLNGRQLDLRGASIQEDVPGKGPALGDADIAKIVADLKAVGANVTRAHYLLNPKLLSALDAAGIMVWSQAPVYHRDRLLTTPALRDIALATVRNTILDARNHPSVITHSVANELSAVPDTVPGTRAFLDSAREVARDADPTIPISVDLLSYPGFGRQKTFARFDLLGINSYFGWYPGKRRHSTAKLSDLGLYLDHMRRTYPRQGLVVTEFGAESTFSGPAGTKETYAFQTQYLKDVLDVVERRPFVGGVIYWTLREFAVKPAWDGGAQRTVPRDSIHNKGLITYAGLRKPAWAVAARRFADTPLYREVSPAVAAGVAGGDGAGGRGIALALAICALVLAVLALDGWAIAGILRGGRERRPAATHPAPRTSVEGAAEPVGARAG